MEVEGTIGFTEALLIKRLKELTDAAESIQTIAHWVIFYRKRHAALSVEIWERELQLTGAERKLTFVYLANEIIQTSRRKGTEFLAPFALVLPAAIRHIYQTTPPSVHDAIMRTITIWEQRQVYSPRFCNDLRFALTPAGIPVAP